MQAPFSAYLFYKRVGGPGDDAREEEYGQGLSGQQMVSRLPAAHRSQLRLVRRRFRQGPVGAERRAQRRRGLPSSAVETAPLRSLLR